jgi:hypothetical protein
LPENRRVLPGGLVCLPSSDPLLCSLAEKPRRETANTLRQLQYIEELIERGARTIRESHVRAFHKLAVDGIYPCAGEYRTITRSAELEGGEVTHVPPEPALVSSLVIDAVNVINARLQNSRKAGEIESDVALVIDVAAYALWRLNWIHPLRRRKRTNRARSRLPHFVYRL